MSWEKTFNIYDFENNNTKVFKKNKKQILIIKNKDEFYAIDNRCPHEGYPLSQGNINKEECLLTCNWHNWKFNLKTGKCIIGQDHVKRYDLKIEDNDIYINLSEAPKEEILSVIINSFTEAFYDRQYGRISRELSKMIFNNLDPVILLKKAFELSYNRLEYGATHAQAVSADWLELYYKSENIEEKLICLTEAIDYLSFESLRHKEYNYSSNLKKWNPELFLKAIEDENGEDAISLLNGFFDENINYTELEKYLSYSALAHYNDFGHALIYVYKTSYLIEKLGKDSQKFLLYPLVRALCYSTREDLLPEFDSYKKLLVNEITEIKDNEIWQKNVNDSMKWVKYNFGKMRTEEIYDKLLLANSKNMLYFDAKWQFMTDNKVSDNVGWLDFTHALTFSNAVRNICKKYPELWLKGILQIACFQGRNIHYINLEQNIESFFVKNENEFWQNEINKIMDHGIALPIFPTHLLKTLIAIKEEMENSSLETKKYLLASLNRFLNSPIKSKHIKRIAKQNLELIAGDFD